MTSKIPNLSGIGTSGRDQNNSCRRENGLHGSSSRVEASVKQGLDLKQFASSSAAQRRWVLGNIAALPLSRRPLPTLET